MARPRPAGGHLTGDPVAATGKPPAGTDQRPPARPAGAAGRAVLAASSSTARGPRRRPGATIVPAKSRLCCAIRILPRRPAPCSSRITLRALEARARGAKPRPRHNSPLADPNRQRPSSSSTEAPPPPPLCIVMRSRSAGGEASAAAKQPSRRSRAGRRRAAPALKGRPLTISTQRDGHWGLLQCQGLITRPWSARPTQACTISCRASSSPCEGPRTCVGASCGST